MKRNSKMSAVILSLVLIFSVVMSPRIARGAEEVFSDYIEMEAVRDGNTVTLTIKAKKAIENLGGFQTAKNGVSYDAEAFTYLADSGACERSHVVDECLSVKRSYLELLPHIGKEVKRDFAVFSCRSPFAQNVCNGRC